MSGQTVGPWITTVTEADKAYIYGGHLAFIKRSATRPTWRDHRTLTIHGLGAVRLLRDLLPYLIVKSEQAELALGLMSIKRQGPRGGLRKALSDFERAERESFRLALLDLRAVA